MKQWIIKDPSPDVIGGLVSRLPISPLTARLLVNRGLTQADHAHAFLFSTLKDLPSPFLLADMDLAVDRLLFAMEKKEKVVIYGDYDVDGTAGSSLLYLFFKEIGYPVEVFIPHRMKDGYSLNERALKKIREEGAKVIVTVDNGITAIKESEIAAQLGLDLIVTDHHEVGEKLPFALAVVNPKRKESLYPEKDICGTGVAYNLIMGLRQKLRERGYFANRKEPNLKSYLDLVALATVADVVPLTGINRIFVKQGLGQMEATRWEGLKALMAVVRVTPPLNPTHLGFFLGPRINACGRLDEAIQGFKLLTAESEAIAMPLAHELDAANRQRQEIEQKILKEAILSVESDAGFLERPAHVLYDAKWHTGVIGIVASKLAERFSRPIVILGQDGKALKGSARSFGGLNLVCALSDCKEHLSRYGGHKAAAGLGLLPENLAAFRTAFERAVSDRMKPEDFLPRLSIDAELSALDLTHALCNELALLEPYGAGNPEPLFCLRRVSPCKGRVVGETHYKFGLKEGSSSLEAIAFGMAKREEFASSKVDLAFSFRKNFYQGRTSHQLNIKDVSL